MNKIAMTLLSIIVIQVYSTSLFLPIPRTNQSIDAPDQPHPLYFPIVTKVSNNTNEIVGYFVSPTGSDSNPGTFSKPWKTLGKAAQMVRAGSTVYILGGTYNEAVTFSTSGTQTQPIKILAYPGQTPIIEGNNQLPTSYRGLITVKGDWVQVSGLEVRNSKYLGVGLYGDHGTASNLFVHHSQKAGIYIGGDYGTVETSRSWRNSMQNELGDGSSFSSGIVAGNDATDGITEYAILRKNIAWENWGVGINTNESTQTLMEDNISHDNFSANIYISDSTNVLCQRNFVYMDPSSYVYGHGSNVGIMLGDERYTPASANITIINNIAYGNLGNLWWWRGDQGGGMNNVLIANNTFVNGIGSASDGRGGVIISRGDHQNVRFENNLVQQDGDLPVIATASQAGITYSHNLWSKTPPSAASGPGDVVGDPGLVKTGTPFTVNWFWLKNTSPAIDKALTLSNVVSDYLGTLRDGAPDLGAVEYVPLLSDIPDQTR